MKSFEGVQGVRIDSTAFWEKRSWRSFVELSLASAGTTTYKIVSAKPFLLTKQQLSCDAGALKVEIIVGGTPGGTFSTGAGQPIQKNRLDGTSGTTGMLITSGGTITGGSSQEVLRVAAGGGNNTTSVNASEQSIRGLPAGTYYIKVTAGTGAATGVYAIEWDEFPV